MVGYLFANENPYGAEPEEFCVLEVVFHSYAVAEPVYFCMYIVLKHFSLAKEEYAVGTAAAPPDSR